jgi:hypothetical protein
VSTGLTGMINTIGTICTKSKTGAKDSCQDVRKTKQRKELMTSISVQATEQDVQPMLSVLNKAERQA